MMESAGVHSFIYFLKRHYVFNANCILLENKSIIILERKRNRCFSMYTKFGLDTKQTCDKKSQKNILRRKCCEKIIAFLMVLLLNSYLFTEFRFEV